MSEAARLRGATQRFEPHFSSAAPGTPASPDPLAELARLVGQNDPFRDVFRRTPAQEAELRGGRLREQPAENLGLRPSSHEGEEHGSEHDARYHADRYRDVGDNHETSSEYDAHVDHGYYAEEHASYADAASGPDGHDPAHHRIPDLWAEGAGPADEHEGGYDAAAGHEATRSPRRSLIVLGAVLVLTGGGLAATFFAKGSANVAAAGKGPPTIMAANGPTKVKLEGSTDVAPEEADAALLSKNGGASGPAKVVNSQEQPVDLNQLPKAGSAGSSADSSPFPEPKKVKTFVVHPDGSMITAAPHAAGDQAARSQPVDIASLAAGTASDGDGTAAPAARPATPKAAARAVTTPKTLAPPPAQSAAIDTADPVSSISKAKQPPAPGVHVQAKPKPTEVASAATALVAAPGGGFGLQLAAAPSEQDARDIFSRLQKKYSGQLGSLKPTIRKVENGDKSVYRVRVGNLGQDEAKTLCSQLQASGGPCFVVRN